MRSRRCRGGFLEDIQTPQHNGRYPDKTATQKTLRCTIKHGVVMRGDMMKYTSMRRMKTLKLPDWAVTETLIEQLCVLGKPVCTFRALFGISHFYIIQIENCTIQSRDTNLHAEKKMTNVG